MIALNHEPVNGLIADNRPTNLGYEEFVQLISTDPELPRQELAKRLNVTRQTIQVWLRRYKANRPMTRRGRPNKYGSIPTRTYTVRLPDDLIKKLGELFPGESDKQLGSRVRSIIDGGMTNLIASFIETASKSQTTARPNGFGKNNTRAANKI